jgi:hypothetical protein
MDAGIPVLMRMLDTGSHGAFCIKITAGNSRGEVEKYDIHQHTTSKSKEHCTLWAIE